MATPSPTNIAPLTSTLGPEQATPVSYAQTPNGSGGFNYTANGKPITVQQYGGAAGMSSAQIAKLAAQGQPAAGGGGGTGGGTPPVTPVAPATTDESADIATQNAGLAAAGTNANTQTGAVTDSLNKLLGSYQTDYNNQQGSYNNESNQNRTNLEANKESALTNAAQGRQGLFGTLAGLGALNGSGIDLANQAVQHGANADLETAANSFATNGQALDKAWGDYTAANKDRIAQANQDATNADNTIKSNQLSDEQKFYTALSNDYKSEGNQAQAMHYATLAGNLYGNLANVPVNTSISSVPLTMSLPALSNNLGVANNTTVASTPSSNIPGVPGANGVPGLIASILPGNKQLQPA